MVSTPDLSIIIPAYNEAARVADTVLAWSAEAQRLGIDHEIIACDDGSTDATQAVLTGLAPVVRALRVRHHPNLGHGPTILDGYRDARGTWVLQIDADDEVGPAPFELFWNARERFDLLVGSRQHRRLAPARRLLTLASRCAVRVLFGGALSDVNSPYRLMHRSMLTRLLAVLPDDLFAPNVAISGLAVRGGFKVLERPVPSRSGPRRRAASWNTMAAGRTSLRQLLAVSRGGGQAGQATPDQRTTR